MYVEREDLYPTPTRVAAAPALWVVDEFLGEREIEALLELFGDEGFVQDHADHYGWDGSGFAAEVAADQHPTLAAVMERIEAALGCTSSLTPTLRFRYYPEEHGHPPHVDAYTEGEHRLAITALITLVAADEGGETRFVDALPEPVAVAPRRGRMVAGWVIQERDPLIVLQAMPPAERAAFLASVDRAELLELTAIWRNDGISADAFAAILWPRIILECVARRRPTILGIGYRNTMNEIYARVRPRVIYNGPSQTLADTEVFVYAYTPATLCATYLSNLVARKLAPAGSRLVGALRGRGPRGE
ncbi:MAG: hypothetical protein KC420_07420 [Myxococcales bacterium]|nr:hypothetical protein [Myxococcales bacterium]